MFTEKNRKTQGARGGGDWGDWQTESVRNMSMGSERVFNFPFIVVRVYNNCAMKINLYMCINPMVTVSYQLHDAYECRLLVINK